LSFPRLHVVTDSLEVVRGVLGHGPVPVQVRVKTNDREAYALTVAALELCADDLPVAGGGKVYVPLNEAGSL
jgi:hypothetical protein